ncbi:hypothetical protein J7E26_15305 [Bacillus sp. ISL-51]|nr:hypothetical protein [Bacillus sp. ISL-51]MBT2712928.1 hypothetical protein [Pseudomonas sp. ISL-88]
MKKMIKKLVKKICEEELERLEKLEKQLDELEDKCHADPQMIEGEKTYVHIEHVKVDKVEYNIDFERLSINELSGILNIGATYHTPDKQLEKADAEEFQDKHQKNHLKEQRAAENKTPNVTIRAGKH